MTSSFPDAFIIEADENWVGAIRCANHLLRAGQRVLQVTGPLGDYGETPPAGSFVLPLTNVADHGQEWNPDVETMQRAAEDAGVTLHPWDGKTPFLAAPLRALIVALYGGGGAPFNQAAILAACGFTLRFLSDTEIRAGALDEVDVLIMPGGGFRAMHGQIEPLGEAGCQKVADWVRRGGSYIGSCAGSYSCAITPESFVRSCPAQRHLQLINARVWNDDTVDFDGLQSPGIGVVTVHNDQPNHPVMFGLPETFDLAHYNGPIFDVDIPSEVEGASQAIGLASFAGWTEQFTPAEAFHGPTAADKETLLQRAIAAGRFSAVAGYLGAGRVIAFGSHPEFGFDLPMVEWGQPARMLANAVLWQAMAPPPMGAYRNFDWAAYGPVSVPAAGSLLAVADAASQVSARVAALQEKPIDPPPAWLTPEYAMSFFGETPQHIWQHSLLNMIIMSHGISELATALLDTVLGSTSDPSRVSQPLMRAVKHIERWVLDERPAEWRQDGGYQGVLALLCTAVRMCDCALARWDTPLGPPDGPYGYMHENPYHLVAGSYLAAIGCVSGALCLLQALEAEMRMAIGLTRPEILHLMKPILLDKQ